MPFGSSIGLCFTLTKNFQRSKNPKLYGDFQVFRLGGIFLAQILSDGLPTISGVRSMGCATLKKFQREKLKSLCWKIPRVGARAPISPNFSNSY